MFERLSDLTVNNVKRVFKELYERVFEEDGTRRVLVSAEDDLLLVALCRMLGPSDIAFGNVDYSDGVAHSEINWNNIKEFYKTFMGSLAEAECVEEQRVQEDDCCCTGCDNCDGFCKTCDYFEACGRCDTGYEVLGSDAEGTSLLPMIAVDFLSDTEDEAYKKGTLSTILSIEKNNISMLLDELVNVLDRHTDDISEITRYPDALAIVHMIFDKWCKETEISNADWFLAAKECAIEDTVLYGEDNWKRYSVRYLLDSLTKQYILYKCNISDVYGARFVWALICLCWQLLDLTQ